MTHKTHLVMDGTCMRCLDCDDSLDVEGVKLTTVIKVCQAFQDTHNEKGCSTESYLAKKMLNDIDAFEEQNND